MREGPQPFTAAQEARISELIAHELRLVIMYGAQRRLAEMVPTQTATAPQQPEPVR